MPTATPTTAWVHPAILAFRDTPTYAAMHQEWANAAANIYGGDTALHNMRRVQTRITILEREAVEAYNIAQAHALMDPAGGTA